MRSHIRTVYGKLQVRNVAEAVPRATWEGGGPETVLVNQTGAPLHRFTASARSYTANRR